MHPSAAICLGNWNLKRQLVNGTQIGGDVFAGFTVAACGAEGKPSFVVLQDDGQAVELRLHHIGEAGLLLFGKKAQQAFAPAMKVVFAKGVCQAEDGDLVLHLGKALGNGAADADSWAVGIPQIGVLFFQ